MNAKHTTDLLASMIGERDRLTHAINALRALGVADAPQSNTPAPAARRRRAVRKPPMAPGELSGAVLRYLTVNPFTNVSAMTDGITAYGVNGPRQKRAPRLYATLRYLESKGKVGRRDNFWFMVGSATKVQPTLTDTTTAPVSDAATVNSEG